jgi:CBS domain-containing protein
MTDANVTMQRRAKEAMTPNVLTVRPEWPVEELADFLVRHGIHGAPVTSEAGDLLGVVSLTDIARASTLSEEDLAAADRHEYYQRLLEEPYPSDPAVVPQEEHAQIRVQEIMTPVVLAVEEDASLRDVAARMVEARVHRLFVTREGKIVGILTALDLLRIIGDI